jgi:peptide/nickel transport system permease protein
MYAGEVVEAAGVLDLFRHARHPYTAGLLAANPSRTRPGHRLPAIPGIVPPPISWPSGCHFADRCPLAERACTDAPIPLFAPQPEHLTRCRRHEQLAGSPEIAVPR